MDKKQSHDLEKEAHRKPPKSKDRQRNDMADTPINPKNQGENHQRQP